MSGAVRAAGAAAVVLALVHAVGSRFREELARVPRSRWLSAAAGVSVAYVFVHLLPEIAAAQRAVDDGSGAEDAVGRHLFVVALAGLALVYGIERWGRLEASQRRDGAGPAPAAWWNLGAFAAYNCVVGAVLRTRAEEGAGPLWLFTFAIALHFILNDVALRERLGELYDRVGRWVVAAAPLLGWVVGAAVELDEVVIGSFVAFLGGGIILNVLKEELPQERESRFWAFAIAAAAYVSLLLVV